MKKRLVAVCLLAVMIATVFSGCSMKERKYVTVIADNINTWLMEAEQGTAIYSYAVTDLDQNGRLEIIASKSYGTGPATESKYYEVSEDGKSLVECKHVYEGDSQADIMSETAKCYKNTDTGELNYVFTDVSGNGFRQVYNTVVALSLTDGEIAEYRLGTESIIYEGDNETPTVTYTDANGQEITEEQYKALAQERFKDCEVMNAQFGWKGYTFANHNKLLSENENALLEVLLDSADKFELSKQK